ncbi:YQGE family putative transporter [Paenibacillus cellulosilyticus]|uniref:YQGE family putative transporter n=1 Tax=Paenibacillus cellulosilyticus TaxID=375489 RepID=A0A2V2Z7T2_9BACL|nr:MFS transporter [Paenibacillus cellulosilyticus]PWW07416.1 YQGE family putative transporter [Paenibacillus cellulosilyticus]
MAEEAAGKRMSGRLDGQSRRLMAVHGMYAAASALSGTFIPVYLWKAQESFASIGWFCMSQYIVSGLLFWIAGKWVKEHNKMIVFRLGIALSGCFYFTVLLLGPSAYRWVVPIGILDGLALGLFWLSYNIIYFEVTEADNRDRYNGIAGLLGAAAGIVAPWLSGFIITTSRNQIGYRIIFTASLIVLAGAVIVSLGLKNRDTEGHYDWMLPFKQLKERGNPWRRFAIAITTQGIRDSVFMFLVGLTVYVATHNEQKVGNYALITSAVALVSFWFVGRSMRMNRRSGAMLIGVLALSAVILPLFFGIRYPLLLIFGVGTALLTPLYMIPITSSVFDLIGRNEESVKQREELIVLRELALTFGRAIGMTAYLLVLTRTHSPAAITWLLFGVGSMPIVGWIATRHLLNRTAAGGNASHAAYRKEDAYASHRTIDNGPHWRHASDSAKKAGDRSGRRGAGQA